MIVYGHHQAGLGDDGSWRANGKWSRDNGATLFLKQTVDRDAVDFGLIDKIDRLTIQPVRVAKGPSIEVAFNDEGTSLSDEAPTSRPSV